jgi:hypothetical protein
MIDLKNYITVVLSLLLFAGCKKGSGGNTNLPPATNFSLVSATINGQTPDATNYNTNLSPVISFSFSTKVDKSSISNGVAFTNSSGVAVSFLASYQNNDSILLIQPSSKLSGLTKYTIGLTAFLKSAEGKSLQAGTSVNFITQIDSTDKFNIISDSALLDLVQQQTFKYFWDFGHPVSGLARERNTSGETVTIGGSGFGVMTIITAINRNFITRQQGLSRLQTIVGFLKNTAQKFHGAFPHWMNGTTGTVVPFSQKDDGADLVETSYMMMGLLCARQYFNSSDPNEIALRNDINSLYNSIDWDFFRQGKNVLYWNWSPNYGFAVNVPVQGWNETLITYVLAASLTTHGISKAVYDSGFARNGAMVNNKSFYGYQLPLGPDYGGPLFFEHYSFMGINPNGLSDQYANYQTQTLNHTKINYEYCVTNPQKFFGYSDQSWGLTASDIPNGYAASSPTNDVGVIAPTAALSSIPYTPAESMKALKFFYYKLGDKLWGQYGFYDAFSLKDLWFSGSYLAIDEGPIIVMIENYRTGLLWNLFMSCPEVKTGMQSLGFQSPYL